eukprot:GHVQ01015891.1.p1 GENE.GHVQ01015891.1~~GHVQ01015891.1.p1  ORF type:complete len:199 (-),score=18.10 GHVQ01015891.1:909-1505(-)
MARNSEKSMAMLNRWVTMKTNIVKGVRGRRPRDTQDCDSLREAEYWRNQVIREVSRKVSEIQNAGLGEHRLRDLNDEINYLLREKARWENRIRELDGPDYRTRGVQIDSLGDEVIGAGGGTGYKYFGAAKDLPGVRELFEKEAPVKPAKTRAQLSKGITPDYFGWRDEDDADLILAEKSKEVEISKEVIQKRLLKELT